MQSPGWQPTKCVALMSDLVICKFRKSWHDTECPYWDQVSLNNPKPKPTPSKSASLRVCLYRLILYKLCVITIVLYDVFAALLVEANTRPFSVSPPVMASLIKNLFELNPEFAQQRPQLFAKYIPQILPPCRESELASYIAEAQQMQRDLRTHPDFIRYTCKNLH